MYETILGSVLMGIGIVLCILGCCSKRRTGSGTGSDTGSVRDSIERAGDNNSRLEETERATSERLREQAATIERAGQDNKDAQQLLQKAKHILGSAKHTD